MLDAATRLALAVCLALAFCFLNGLNDSGALVATMVSTGALSLRRALSLACLAILLGPFLFGFAVANTLGAGLVKIQQLPLDAVSAALLAATIWSAISSRLGLPISSTHALVGGIVGSALAAGGSEMLLLFGLVKVGLALLIGPVLGGFLGYISLKLTIFLAQGATPKVNRWFKHGQIVTSFALALGYGAMDAQKTMGIIAMALITSGFISTFTVPLWAMVVTSAVLALGVLVGGWHTIKTLGLKIYRVRPVHGFTSQAASALVIIASGLLGGPLSTAQVVSSAIVGAGAGERVSKVRWGVAGSIIIAWSLTMPVTAFLAALAFQVLAPVLHQ